jgi:hypothetical protein
MCPILDGYRVLGILYSRTRPCVNRVLLNQLAGDVLAGCIVTLDPIYWRKGIQSRRCQ